MKFVDVKNDIAFKKIFGNSNKKEILISFLNAILDFQGKKAIKDVNILNAYQLPQIKELKDTILDIRAINQNNEQFIVEMQKKDLGEFDKRSQYYAAKTYVEQLNRGDDYQKLQKVYFIAIINFKMFSNTHYISRHLTIHQETQIQELDGVEFSFVELPKFQKKLEELENITDKWVYFIKNAKKLEIIPKEFEDLKEFQEAFLIANQFNWSKEEMEIYDYVKLKEMDERNAIKTAEQKGIEKGIREGVKKGKIEIVKNSLKQNLDIETISLITGLTSEEIEELKVDFENNLII